jgi:hypothetical protein
MRPSIEAGEPGGTMRKVSPIVKGEYMQFSEF